MRWVHGNTTCTFVSTSFIRKNIFSLTTKRCEKEKSENERDFIKANVLFGVNDTSYIYIHTLTLMTAVSGVSYQYRLIINHYRRVYDDPVNDERTIHFITDL